MINEFRPMNHLTSLQNFICTIGNLPTSYVLSLSYEEQIWWICDFLEKKVFPAIEENTNITEETQQAFIELQNYVRDYFNNLDVQDEINNKLDIMAEDGTLQEIISEYLNSKAIFGFDNVNEMKQASNLIDGSYARTLGYYSKNDGGSSLYRIRNITNSDVVDNASLIPLNNQQLIAELIVNDYVNPRQFGAKSNSLEDDAPYIKKCFDYALEKNLKVSIFEKYYINSEIIINKNSKSLIVEGTSPNSANLTQGNYALDCNFIMNSNGVFSIQGLTNVKFENIGFYGNNGKAIKIQGFRNKVIACHFNNFATAIEIGDGSVWVGENQIGNCTFMNTNLAIKSVSGSDSDIFSNLCHSTCNYFIDCRSGGAGYKIENNHDYSLHGSDVSGYSTLITGNYIDGFDKLRVHGNSGLTITGNMFLGVNTESGKHYCIKYCQTSSNTVISGCISGNSVNLTDNSIVYDDLYFINIEELSYFSYVTISGNNLKVCKHLFDKGNNNTATYYCIIDQRNNATVSKQSSAITITESFAQNYGPLVVSHIKFTRNNTINDGSVVRLIDTVNLMALIAFVKLDDGDYMLAPKSSRGGSYISLPGDYNNATNFEIIAFGITEIPDVPNLI